VATHRLLLEADVHTALAAMQAVDERLKGLPDPGLLAVRKQVLADMDALRASGTVDISGLALYLAALVERAERLPLKELAIRPDIRPETGPEPAAATTTAPEDASRPWWARLLSSIWRELKDVIIISHADDQAHLALLPQQTFFLRQNLRLQLETARYAVLRRDTALLHSSAETITAWLRRYFAVSNNSVGNIIESLSQMRSLDLNPPLPDISSSLETMRAYIRAARASPEEQEPREEGEMAQ